MLCYAGCALCGVCCLLVFDCWKICVVFVRVSYVVCRWLFGVRFFFFYLFFFFSFVLLLLLRVVVVACCLLVVGVCVCVVSSLLFVVLYCLLNLLCFVGGYVLYVFV